MKPVWNVDNEWLCSPNHAYLIEREKVQATVFEKPSSARAIVSSFWIMKLGWSTRNTLVPTVATAEWRDLG